MPSLFASSDREVILEDFRVLDLADERGLVAGRLLADLGADVVRVSGLSFGDPVSIEESCSPTAMTWRVFGANRRRFDASGIQGSSEDLFHQADAAILSGTPHELATRNLTPKDLAQRFPHLIVAVVSPFGLEGPRANWPATDLTVWAAGGPLEPHRSQDGVPLRPSAPQAFLHAGADAAIGVLLAYLARQDSGRGQIVDVSAQASLSSTTLGRVLADIAGDPNARLAQRQLVGLDRSGSGAATSGDFKKWNAKDGIVELHLAMGPASGRFTNNFMEWMIDEGAYPPELPRWDWVGVPDAIERGDFTDSHLDAVREATRSFLATKTRNEVRQAALERRLLCIGISEIDDVADDPHFAERGIWTQVGDPETTVLAQWCRSENGCSPEVGRGYPAIGDPQSVESFDWLESP